MVCKNNKKEYSNENSCCSNCSKNENIADPFKTQEVKNETLTGYSDDTHRSADACENKTSTAKKIGAIILCIFLAMFLVCTTCLIVIRDAISPDTIMEMIRNINLNDIEINDVVDKELLEEHGLICESDNLFDIIYDNIDQNELPYPISKDGFRSLVENKKFREYFGSVFGTSIEALTSGNSSDVVTPDDIVDYLASNREEFSQILGYELNDERLYNLKETLTNDYGMIFSAIADQRLNSIVGEDAANAIDFVFSDWLFWLLIIFDILICIFIFLIFRSLSKSVKYCSISMITVGAIFFVVSIAVLNGLLSALVGGPLIYVFNQLISVVLWETIVISVILIVIGMVAPISVKIIARYKNRVTV